MSCSLSSILASLPYALKAEYGKQQERIIQRHAQNPACFWRRLLYYSFWLFVAFFPAGYGWREVMPPICLVFLVLYYHSGWNESALKRLHCRWLFFFLAAMVLIGTVFSTNYATSIIHAGTALNKGFILPFIAMECAHNEEDIRGLVWAFVLCCFWEGIDGIWQALHGADFIMGYAPNAGRLTGSLGDYTVGNFLALAMIPAFGVFAILRRKFNLSICVLLFAALFWPPFFLFIGASSRSGLIALFTALFIFALLHKKKDWIKYLCLPCLLVLVFIWCQPDRLSIDSISGDNRWDLWRLGWNVFLDNPLTGSGPGTYNEAFKSLGLLPLREDPGISHPHNLYLDMLYAHGIGGFLCGMIFISGFLIWGWRNIKAPLKKELQTGHGIYWNLTLWFWLGFVGWLANGVFGHDFYRTWWLSQAMIALGLAIGATIFGGKNASEESD